MKNAATVMDFPALYTVLKLAKKENEDENKRRHSARELAIILGTCLPHIFKGNRHELTQRPCG
ncbi:hypothetical protein ECED1_5083 [Escherichia coli ED1a]|jgi:hypothetical protein|uniref:Uncharacterized protein n=1 Tax=Escherichia coli O81 (strain ED1a) TaxID=585397 RepID=B7MSW3_ECO81|nr:hypothetical protein ECED1_5083 [Escherichia coli ED1a]